MESTYHRLLNLIQERVQLDASQLEALIIEHPEAHTCEQAAELRGSDLSWGGKTLLLKGNKEFFLIAMPAVKQMNSNSVRKLLKYQRLRFGTADELSKLCGVVSGALPPVGRPLFDLPLFVDSDLLANEKTAFNLGRRDRSIILSNAQYRSLLLDDYQEISL